MAPAGIGAPRRLGRNRAAVFSGPFNRFQMGGSGHSSTGGDLGHPIGLATRAFLGLGVCVGEVRFIPFNERTARLHCRSSHDQWRVGHGQVGDGFGSDCVDLAVHSGCGLSLSGDRRNGKPVFIGWLGHAVWTGVLSDWMRSGVVATVDMDLEKSGGRDWRGPDGRPWIIRLFPVWRSTLLLGLFGLVVAARTYVNFRETLLHWLPDF